MRVRYTIPHICQGTIYDVLLYFTIFCCKIIFLAIYTVLSQNLFMRFCVEKNLAKICVRGEKMTNMRYGLTNTDSFVIRLQYKYMNMAIFEKKSIPASQHDISSNLFRQSLFTWHTTHCSLLSPPGGKCSHS